jgi:hypothetical protein
MQVRVTPNGLLDQDTDLSYVGRGNYVEGNDVRHRQVDGGNFGGVMGTEGNLNLITEVNGSPGTGLPTITAQQKKYRIYMNFEPFASSRITAFQGTISVENASGVITTRAVSLSAPSVTTFASFAQLLQLEFDALCASAYASTFIMSPSTAPYYTSTGTNTGYFTLAGPASPTNEDFILRVANTTPAAPLCQIVLEDELVITADPLVLKVIGSYQLEDYLFVWSASERATNAPTSDFSEIGVIYTTNGGASFTYKTLVRSRKLGFSKERRVDAQIERVGSQINFYWTDGYGKPRAMYLKYSLVTTQNGFMFTTGGRYELETIDEESSFFYRVPSATIENLQVVPSGGTITAGNKRYTGRFLTEDFVTTEFLYPTNPVNIYAADPSSPSRVAGDPSGTVTSKSVTMRISNFPAGVYRYFELVAIEYSDEGYTATVVQRYSLSPDVNELDVQHVGIGQDNIPLGANELVAIFSRYQVAQNMRIFDNRMVLSNVQEQVDKDLSAWASAFTHVLDSKAIPAIGSIIDTPYDFLDGSLDSDTPRAVLEELGYPLEEYLEPTNTKNYTGYIFNDTYRFGVQVKWKDTGKWSAPYYVDDIRFDSLAYNINVATSRRAGNTIQSNLTDSTGDNVYVNYVKFGNINLNYPVAGVPLRNLIEGFRIVRADRIPEVLASGYFFLGTDAGSGKRAPHNIAQSSAITSYTFGTSNVLASSIDNGSPHGFLTGTVVKFSDVGPGIINLNNDRFYFIRVISTTEFALRSDPNGSDIVFTASGGSTNDFILSISNLPQTHTSNGSEVLFFHSPELFYRDRSYVFDVSTCSLKILGPTLQRLNVLAQSGSFSSTTGTFVGEFDGYFSSASREYIELKSSSAGSLPDLKDYAKMEQFQTRELSVSGYTAQSFNRFAVDVFGLNGLLRLNSGSNFPSGLAHSENSGIFYGQLFRNLGANRKYPVNIENTVYGSTGHYYYLTPGQSGTLSGVEVFGGDTFTQKTFTPIAINAGGYFGQLMVAYCQNTVNAQMLSIDEDSAAVTSFGYRWPHFNPVGTGAFTVRPSGFDRYLSYTAWNNSIWAKLAFSSSGFVPQREYNASYTLRDGTIMEQGYLKDDFYDGTNETKIVWSSRKALGSQRDGYRLGFGPADVAELDISKGPITHHEVVNGSFYTMQPFSFQRQYFRDASLIGADAGTDVVIGSGSILGAPGVELSAIGTEHKWSAFKGQSPNGKESMFWFNNRLQKIIRFAGDGVVVISDRGMISRLQNSTKWLNGRVHPLTGSGVHGVWNDRFAEAIFTFKAINPTIPAWVTSTIYTTGSLVFISPSNTYLHASGLPFVYKAKSNHTSAAASKPETGANWQTFWEKITPGTDPNVHTLMTLVYDEPKNGFICEHSYWPDIYLQYQNGFFSPNPLDPATIYLHDRNTNRLYYGSAFNPSITMVMNYDPNQAKIFDALQLQSQLVPASVRFYTPTHESFLESSDWDLREGLYYAPVKNDTLTAAGGLNSLDTSRLWGKWLKIKFFIGTGSTKQKLINAVVRFRPMTRLYNQ